jgi:outer membrane receptor protein involved in Fe transport
MIAPAAVLIASLVWQPLPTHRDPAGSSDNSSREAPGYSAGQNQPSSAPESSSVTGIVRDESGKPLPDVSIVVRTASGGQEQTTSGPDGRFASSLSTAGDIVLIVRKDGFAEKRQALAAGMARRNIEVVLALAGVAETVTVTASRLEQTTSTVAASVNLLDRQEIKQSPAIVADDVLRQIPTFSLFRRTSSLASHPTTQGVSLRGIGPSGVSRTLVLLDGVPFNDAFGGWVYWTRIPLESVERIEAVDTASSSLYGNYAMGGVINIVTAPASRRTFELRSQYGSRSSPKVDFLASDVWQKVQVIVDGSAFSTDGYAPVIASERGVVDNNASVGFGNVNVKLQYDATERVRAFVRAGYFHEDRDNGKASTIDGTEEANSTTWKSASAGVQVRLPDDSSLHVNGFVDVTRFRSNFLAVPAATPPRSIGRMTLNQRVPATSFGGTAQWWRPIGGMHVVTAGADWRWVDGDSEEDGLDALTGTQVTLNRISGGTQRSAGLFLQDVMTPTSKLMLTLSGRVDHWRNYDAHNLEINIPSGVPTTNHRPTLPGKENTVGSPRAAALYRLTDRVSVWGDLGWGFRAPTLNELYRQFRVGTVLTLANNQLGPERLFGGEVGVKITPLRNLLWRTTWFGNRVRDPVSNVTIATSGAAVTQQRQNLGRTRIRGIQTDVEYRFGSSWRLSGGYLYDDARVREFALNPVLVGKFLPQVPRHRGSVRVAYTNPRYANVAIGVEAIGRQFDDDLNERTVPGHTEPGLPGYALVNLTASRPIGRNLEVLFGVQNLFDQEFIVGTLPTTIGAPRLVTGGIRVRFSGKPSSR